MKRISLLLVALSTLFSCTKEGPEGPQGLQGDSGIGKLYSVDYSINQWFTFGTFGNPGFGYIGTAEIPELNFDELTKGLIVTYQMKNAEAIPLPISIMNASFTTYINVKYLLNLVEIRISESDGLTSEPVNLKFRTVIIPQQMIETYSSDWKKIWEASELAMSEKII
jgi:hypothetical protein